MRPFCPFYSDTNARLDARRVSPGWVSAGRAKSPSMCIAQYTRIRGMIVWALIQVDGSWAYRP